MVQLLVLHLKQTKNIYIFKLQKNIYALCPSYIILLTLSCSLAHFDLILKLDDIVNSQILEVIYIF